LAVIGAFASIISLLIVGGIADWQGIANAHGLVSHPHDYLGHHPLRVLWIVAVSLALAYGLAWVAARAIHPHAPSIRPAGSAWTEAFIVKRPASQGVRLTAELRDGRKIEGIWGGMTGGAEENRELFLRAPFRISRGQSSPATKMSAAFVLLRETDILAISGEYVEPVAVKKDDEEPAAEK
jgi:Family of unknown function (DUF6338)